jgi:hypothetical protein
MIAIAVGWGLFCSVDVLVYVLLFDKRGRW